VGDFLDKIGPAGRQDIVLATKFHGQMGEGPNRQGNSRRWIISECEASLRRLRTDYIDLPTRP
jgi:aryl-alcohol dehydrogenase-like predicted oxidoreductase